MYLLYYLYRVPFTPFKGVTPYICLQVFWSIVIRCCIIWIIVDKYLLDTLEGFPYLYETDRESSGTHI